MTVPDQMWDVMQLVDESGDVAFDFVTASPDAVVTDFDPGFPDARSVTADRPNGNGSLNTTQYHGSRGISMTVSLDPAKPAQSLKWQKQLLTLCMPYRRPWLYLRTIDDPRIWRIQLVGSSISAAYQVVMTPQLSWVAPEGEWETADDSEWTIFPSGTSTSGLTMPVTFPINFGSGSPAGSVILDIDGTEPTPPIIRIYGPITGPGITNTTTGQAILFLPTFTIPSGGYVSINCATGDVTANDDPSLSRLNFVDGPDTDYWFLQPGQNQISFTGTAPSGITKAVITWRERTV